MEDFVLRTAIAAETSGGPDITPAMPTLVPSKPKSRSLTATLGASKDEIRTSLQASTLDGVFATLFTNVTGGVLLTNVLLELGANPTEVGILASIPMIANLMQPLGAYFSEQTTSRHDYCLWIYGISRSLWIGLAIAILSLGHSQAASDLLIAIALGVALISYGLGALGSAPWLSWMAALVPPSLRGRYFGLRSSAANVANLVSVPILGFGISQWQGGSLQGYGIVLLVGIAAGLISLWFQNFMVDVNPQTGRSGPVAAPSPGQPLPDPGSTSLFQPISLPQLLRGPGVLNFLVYFNLWTFAVNLCAPFFNVYMLHDLALDISQVTLYNSLSAGANLLLLMFWGRLADRIGNRPILMGVGLVFAISPLLWIIASPTPISTWVWLPLLHLLAGATAAAIDLCSNNLQIGIAPASSSSTFFGITAALAGVSGALGTAAGGFWVQFGYGGWWGLFVISSLLRLVALIPLLFVQEQPSVQEQLSV